MTLDAPFPSGESGTISKRRRSRLAVALFYFGMGLCFASWAGRIPDIKTALGLNDAHFGTILFAMPVGQFLMMPFSGKLVTRFGSSGVLLFAVPAYTLILCLIGLVSTGWQLAMVLFLFGLAGNMCNISINTQGVTVERWYGRQIMASFHGSRSLAGFTGALTGLVMMNLKLIPFFHFVIIAAVVWLNLFVNRPYLIRGRTSPTISSFSLG
jgi:MFS family permease